MDAEFGLPQWAFGMGTFAFEKPTSIICAYTQGGRWHLARLNTVTSRLDPVEVPYTVIGKPLVAAGHVVFTAGSAAEPSSIVRMDLQTGEISVLRRASEVTVEPGYLYDVITNGYGAMLDYSAQIPVEDRWRIVAYLRALQLSRQASPEDLSADQRQALRTGTGEGG